MVSDLRMYVLSVLQRPSLIVQVNTRLVEQQIYDGPSGLGPVRNAFRAKL